MSRSMSKTESRAVLVPFRVARVEKTSAPDGTADAWYRYVLDNGRSTITGLRQGPLKEVTAYAERCAEQINARGQGKTSMWAPRGRKPAAAANSGGNGAADA
jgi:hypothetical protein